MVVDVLFVCVVCVCVYVFVCVVCVYDICEAGIGSVDGVEGRSWLFKSCLCVCMCACVYVCMI